MRFDVRVTGVAAIAALGCAQRAGSGEDSAIVARDATSDAPMPPTDAPSAGDAASHSEPLAILDASVTTSTREDAEIRSLGASDTAGSDFTADTSAIPATTSEATSANQPGDGGSTEPAGPCLYTFTSGHGDVYLAYEAGQFELRLRADLTGSQVEQLFEPESVCIHVPASTRSATRDFGGRPSGEQWDFLGIDAGESFWFLPQTARSDAPWLGLASATWPRSFGDHARSSLRIVDAPNGAHFSAWFSDAFGAPQVELASSAGDWSLDLAVSVHAHLNWAFTQPGSYVLELTATFEDDDAGVAPQHEPVARAAYRVEVLP